MGVSSKGVSMRSLFRLCLLCIFCCCAASSVWAAEAVNGAANATQATSAVSTKGQSGGSGNGTKPVDLTDPDASPLPAIEWTEIESGLDLGLAHLPPSVAAGNEDCFVILRIDPKLFDFSLHMASETGTSHSLKGWAEAFGLRAGINASMYLPDNLTSTGLLRSSSHVNNAKAGSRLGAFFVAGPKGNALPRADILERGAKDLNGRLERYGQVAQNYRLISGSGEILWSPGVAAHSIAVVAKDAKGRIVFILCQEPLTPHTFARYVQKFSLELAPVMYVEGGAPAGLFLLEDTGGAETRPGAVSYPVPGGVLHVWKGRQSFLRAKGNPEALLPNIIGVKAQGVSK